MRWTVRRWAVDVPAFLFLLAVAPLAGASELSPTRTWSGGPATERDAERASVVDENEIRERGQETVADTLREEPGVHVQSTNRGAGAPMLRGQVGPGVLIVYDGVRVNDSTFRSGPNQYLNLFDPWSLERVEVLRGSAGTAWGSDAIGGVIFLAPPPLLYRRGFGVQLIQRFESSDLSLMGSPDVMWSGDNVSIRLGGNWTRHGELRAGEGHVVPASDYGKFGARGSIGLLTGPRSEVELHYAGGFIRGAGRIDRLADANVRFSDNDQHLVYARYTLERTGMMDRLVLLGSLKRSREETLRFDCIRGNVYGFDPPVLTTINRRACVGGQPGDLAGRRLNLDSAWVPGMSATVETRPGPEGLRVAFGVDGQMTVVDSSEEVRFAEEQDRWVAGDARSGNYVEGAWMGLFGLFALASWEVEVAEDHTLVPQAGVRLDHARAGAEDVPGLGGVNYDWTGVTGSAGATHHVGDVLSVHAMWDQGFRAPNLQETTLLGNTGNFFEVPNDALRPERANGLELGAGVSGEPGRVDVRTWVMRISDFIDREPATFLGNPEVDGTEVVRRVNAGRAELVGVEGAVESASWQGLSLRGTTGWIRGRVEDGDDWQPIRREPPLRWSAALNWDFEPWSSRMGVFAEGAAAQPRLNRGDEGDHRICSVPEYPGVLYRDLGLPCPGSESWAVVGLRFRQDFSERSTLRMRVSNLLDRRYRYHASGFDSAGFSVMISLESRWGSARELFSR